MIETSNIFRILGDEKAGLAKLGVTGIGLFGSYVRGEASEESDVDILLDLSDDSPVTLFSLVEIERFLSEKLHTKVDLVLKRDLKREIGKRILSEVKYV